MSSTPVGGTQAVSMTTLQQGSWKWVWPQGVLTPPSCWHLLWPVCVHKHIVVPVKLKISLLQLKVIFPPALMAPIHLWSQLEQ